MKVGDLAQLNDRNIVVLSLYLVDTVLIIYPEIVWSGEAMLSVWCIKPPAMKVTFQPPQHSLKGRGVMSSLKRKKNPFIPPLNTSLGISFTLT